LNDVYTYRGPAAGFPPVPQASGSPHPITAFLIMIYILTPAFVLQSLWAPLDILPLGFGLWDSLGTVIGVMVPAFLVVAALHGRAGIRDLASRSLRWRVAPRWYFIALFALPAGVVLCASAIYGMAPLAALGAKGSLFFTLLLPDFLIRLVLFNLPEEIGFMGFLQSRLQDQHGPLKAVILTEIPFALWHIPDVFLQTEGEFSSALLVFGVFTVAQFFGRVVIMWLYNNTLRSVFLVGLFHAAHNTTINRFTDAFIPGPAEIGFFITEGIVMAAAVLLLVFTKGRLSYRPDQVERTNG
ncbi:MAG: CPBP family intramembrane metalloprotease, partial [Chloroflexi bacterium]